jgi:hypothetical protein
LKLLSKPQARLLLTTSSRPVSTKRTVKTKKYYDSNPKAYQKKKEYDTEYHSTDERKKYRAELNRKNRQAGKYGNGDGLDYDHTERRFISAVKNRSKK